jgi:hypothetical protein
MTRCGQEDVSVNTNTCHHLWRIDTPNGSVSHGKCKVCGLEKDFLNTPIEVLANQRRNQRKSDLNS